MSQAFALIAKDELRVRKQLLRVVLRDTMRTNGVPAEWISAETKLVAQSGSAPKLELQLSVDSDEPRFQTYLTAFQADFKRRLLTIEPTADDWFSALTWRLRNEPAFEVSMPAPIFWDKVSRDRETRAPVDYVSTLPTPRRAKDLAKG